MSWIRQRPATVMLLLSIVACVFEGTLRKWVFRESGGLMRYACYFSKDFIWIALVLFCRPTVETFGRQYLGRVLAIGIPLVLLGVVLSGARDLNLVGGVLSFRALVLLPLLAYLSVSRISGMKIDVVVFVVGGLTVLNAVLGITQYSSPIDAAINYYANEDVAGAVAFEENVRAVGTFSYISGYANLATVGSWAGLAVLCLARGRLSYIIAGWGFYVASLVCALVSISRGTVITALAMLVVLAVSGKDAVVNLAKGIAALTAILFIGYAFNLNPMIVKLSDTVIERHELAGDTVESRTLDPILQIGPAAAIAPMGLGFGTEQVAGVFAETGVMAFHRFEWQFPRLVLETGLIGLAGFLITCIGTIYVIFKTRARISDEGLRRVFVLSAFLAGSLFYTNVVFNHIASFFAWIIVAVTLASSTAPPQLPRIKKQYVGRMAGATS